MAQYAKDNQQRFIIPGADIAELLVNVTGELPPEFADWPARIQDEVHKAIERLNLRTEKRYELVSAGYGYVKEDDVHFIRVVAVSNRVVGQKPIAGDH